MPWLLASLAVPGTAVGAPWGVCHLYSPLKTVLARGVSPHFGPLRVFIGSLTAKPDALGSRLCPAEPCHAPSPPSTPQAHQPPIFQAPWIHANSRRPRFSSNLSRRPRFSSNLGRRPAVPWSPCCLFLPTPGLSRAGWATAAHAISSRKSCNLLFHHNFFVKM